PIWEATESVLAAIGVPPPYWAFAWPGGQALARHLLDTPNVVAGRRVLDFAAGSGLTAIAAAMAGAAAVTANDIDAFAAAAIRLNAAANGRSEEHTSELQSRENLVCRLLLEKKKQATTTIARRP